MTTQLEVAPIRQQVLVNVTPERAFKVFTTGMHTWWLKSHSIGKSPLAEIVVEPKAGGLWAEVGEDGSRCQWGRVLIWEPPSRLVLVWAINSNWQYDPDLHTEVEVTFAPEGSATRVALEHRNLAAFGEHAADIAATFASPGGWPGLLAAYEANAT